MQRLAILVRQAMEEETALKKIRGRLSDEDQVALDGLFAELREYQMSAGTESMLSPFEGVLLLMLVKQQRRVECLEFLFQRNAARMLQDWTQAIQAKRCERR